jgi:hypothetical protein
MLPMDACEPRIDLHIVVLYYTHFAGQDWASHIKISQIAYFSCVFSGKKTLAHGETKT